jgi:Ca2+/Na+ antiporter
MSFTDRLLLWLHIGFAIFSLGPVAAAMMVTPRYIRRRDLAVLRYLYRTTRIFGAMTLGVFVFGLLLGRNDFKQAWLSVAMTLFIVAAVLLVLVFRDQRRAISAIDKALAVEAAAAPALDGAATSQPPDGGAADATYATEPAEEADAAGSGQGTAVTDAAGTHRPGGAAGAAATATVERGRIASLGGVICAIWLTILVLMVWHTGQS